MKLFISWSGKKSKALAIILREWLEMIFPSLVEPWMSAKDLRSGEWRRELEQQLDETNAGIVCLTPENFNPSWMLYEVGFMSRSVKGAFVVPYLLDMDKAELLGPLEQFQARVAEQEDTRVLVETINKALGTNRLDSKVLDNRFDALWPNLEKKLKELPAPEISVDVKNERGITLRRAITRVGLTDIENRNDEYQLALPPEKFYKRAKREIVITGVSAYRTFESQIDVLRATLKADKKVHILILHPNAPDVKRLSKIENPNIKNNIDEVITIIKKHKFHKNGNFEIRFMQRMPPFFAVMIDGDISAPDGSTAHDQDGQIRVQPRSQYGTNHKGIVLQLRKTIASGDEPAGGFDYFAQDVRNQWRLHGKVYPELFA